MVSNLTEFLLARIAEDEAAARGALDGRWTWASVDFNSSIVAEHGNRHGPERVLRECEAKRLLLEREWSNAEARPDWCYSCSGPIDQCVESRLIAAVYAGHPDYLPEWRPAD